MVKTYEAQENSSKFYKYEQVDCLDETGAWLNAEVVELAPNKVKVHFSNYSSKFDIWVDENSDKILKQWRHGQNFVINNRVDVLDSYSHWKEALIIDMNEAQIKVHYKGYVPKYDEWIHKNSNRIQEIGSKSTAQGIGRTDPSNASRYSKKEIQSDIKKVEFVGPKELQFVQALSERQLVIIVVEGDGNCLFRSVSHQLYGSTQFHDIIRLNTMKYISIEREYFSQFIVGGLDKIDEYLEYQRRNGAWGDDVEIQAMSEIYNKPFEIYAYSNTPMRTFHENSGSGRPLRLSYHGQSHYNSISDKDKHLCLLNTTPGEYEDQIIERANRGEIRELITNAREEFEACIHVDLEAMINSTDQHESEDIMIRQAIEDSENSEYLKVLSQSLNENSEEELIKHAIEISKNDAIPAAVIDVMNSGFTMEQAIEAYYIVGDNPNQMIEYIFNSIL